MVWWVLVLFPVFLVVFYGYAIWEGRSRKTEPEEPEAPAVPAGGD